MLVAASLGIPDLDDFGMLSKAVDVPVVVRLGLQVVPEPGRQSAGSEGAADIGIEAL
jgi:hypothetical protein